MSTTKAVAVAAWTKQLFSFATTFAFFTLAANLQNTALAEAQAEKAAEAALAASLQVESTPSKDSILTTALAEASKPKGPGLNAPPSAEEEITMLVAEVAAAPAPTPAPAPVEVDGHSSAS